MRIEPKNVTIRELAAGYMNDDEKGVTGYSGLLDIRPAYQREFVYRPAQRDEVVRTVLKGLPLNVMYWCETADGRYELMDGQQRTVSVCEYIVGHFSIRCESALGTDSEMYFYNLQADMKKRILDYGLLVYVCSGEETEKLEWFRIINIAGERLTDQELRNAIYAGPWTSSAKRHFSKTGCAAMQMAGDYLKGAPIRQDYLECALGWIADKEKTTIDGYMASHQHDGDAHGLWAYFREVIEWVGRVFPVKRKSIMKGLAWGIYYNEHGHRQDLDADALEAKIKALLEDEDVTRKAGVYEYVLSGNERALSIRTFDMRDRLAAYERQEGVCALCKGEFPFEKMHADHIIAWSEGGRTVPENCQMLCTRCNTMKSNG